MIAALLRERGPAVLAALLAVQVVILVVTRLPGRSAAPEPLLAGLTAEAAERIEIDDGADGRLTLARRESGWVVTDAGGYPADGTRVTELLDRLTGARQDRLVARTDAGRRELRVLPDDYERRLRVDAGDQAFLLYVGADVGANGAHVRVDGRDEVWSVDGLASWQVSTDSAYWVDPIYVRVEPDRIAAFELQNAAGAFRFERTEEGWTAPDLGEGEAVDQERLTDFADRFSALRMQQPLGTAPPETGFDPVAMVRIALRPAEDGAAETPEADGGADDPASADAPASADDPASAEGAASVEIAIGAGGGDGVYVVKSADSEYYVEVSSFTLADLVDADRSAFVTAGDAGGPPSGDPSQ